MMGLIANVLMFFVVAVVGGIASAWLMIDRGSPLSVRQIGPWSIWATAGRTDADPYARAHVLRSGVLPMSPTLALTYIARTDNDGRKLHSACEYAVEGRGPQAAWWSLAVFDDEGKVIRNAAERYAFNSSTVMRSPGGTFLISLARDARPGNWLPTSGGGRIVVVLTVQHPSKGDLAAADSRDIEAAALPSIRRVACR